jgi:ABC-2 type transport system permease protein
MKTTLVAVLGEVRKNLLVNWTYRANLLLFTFTLTFIFIAISFMMTQGAMEPERLTSTLVGYLTWMFAMSAIGEVTWEIRSEINAGTLEQMSMSPAPVGIVLIGRMMASVIFNVIRTLLVIFVMYQLFDVRIPVRWQGAPVLLVTLLGVYGFGYVVAGAMLVFKQFESFANLMQNALVFLNGSVLPIDRMPGWLSAVSRTLPSTQGIVVLRRVLLDGQSLASVWQDGSLVWLIVHSAIYLAVGWFVFGCCERIAKRRGSLGHY